MNAAADADGWPSAISNREAIEAALQNGMDPAELKRLIDDAAAAMRANSFNAQWQPDGQRCAPASGAAAAQDASASGSSAQPAQQQAGRPASPWQGGSTSGRRRPGAARRSPFEQPAPR